jgi:hypothetical protein
MKHIENIYNLLFQESDLIKNKFLKTKKIFFLKLTWLNGTVEICPFNSALKKRNFNKNENKTKLIYIKINLPF